LGDGSAWQVTSALFRADYLRVGGDNNGPTVRILWP